MKQRSFQGKETLDRPRNAKELTTCFNVSPSLVELSNEELETITANLFNDLRRLNTTLFFEITPVRFVRPTVRRSFSDLICSLEMDFNVLVVEIEFRIFN